MNDATNRFPLDRDAAERVLAPVLENACRYARSRATVEVSTVDGHVEFVVSDDGPGVAREECELVFEPGRRGSASPTDSGRAGLGLALSRRLALALDGDVENLESADGGRFCVRMPIG